MSVGGMGPCVAVIGSTTAAVFEAYVEQVLCPSLKHEQVVVMDNLSAHKGERVKDLIEQQGCESIRWYLGYDLTETLPDHSSLTKIRERYGLEVFRRFF
jgi:hypothetical protein